MTAGEDVALLMSGGIGDYLHYIARLDSLLEREEIDPRRLAIFVESTAPQGVMSLFATALPDLSVRFTPPPLQWTRAHPLLDVLSSHDRLNRPAYRYVSGFGFRRIIDWFLPFCCDDCPPAERRLRWLLAGDDAVEPTPSIAVSLRDKGFLWWPSRDICLHVRNVGRRLGLPVQFLGTPPERPMWLPEMLTAPDGLAALRLAAAARLFIATDTGLTTIRELLGLPSIYCINEYWHHDVMVRHGYLSDAMLARSGSLIACDAAACLKAFNLSVLGLLSHSGRQAG
jgi:hypothetical protein